MYSHYSSYKWIGSTSAPEDTCRFLSHKITLCRPLAAEGSRIRLTRACIFTWPWPWPSSFYDPENLVHIVDCHVCLMDKTHLHKAKGHYNIDTLHRCLFSWTASSLKSGFLSYTYIATHLELSICLYTWSINTPWLQRCPTSGNLLKKKNFIAVQFTYHSIHSFKVYNSGISSMFTVVQLLP